MRGIVSISHYILLSMIKMQGITMRMIQTRVYLYTLFPILLLPCALWLDVTSYPLPLQPISSSALALLILITWGWLINFYIKKKIVEPILELNQRLEEPEKKLTQHIYSECSIFQSLLVKLNNRESALNEDLQESSVATIALQCAFIEEKNVLEERIRALSNDVLYLQKQSDITENHYQTLARLTQYPLQTTINNTRSLMQQPSSAQAQKCRVELMRGTDNLQFLVGQICASDNRYRQQPYISAINESAQLKVSQIDLHQLVDSVISLVSPILDQVDRELVPIFDQSCRFQPIACEMQIRQLLFHTLLIHSKKHRTAMSQQGLSFATTPYPISQSSDKGFPSEEPTQISLKIRMKSRWILFELDDNSRIEDTPELRKLLNACRARLDGKVLAIPALASTRSNPLVTHHLSYRIFCSDQKQYASLSSRLKNVGMKVSQDPSKAEVAFILHRQSDDIQNALARLHHKTTVYLLEHDLAYQKKHWHRLTYPIYQSDLLYLLKLQSKPEHQQQALVLDDSAQNRKILSELILTLGHRVIESGTPAEAIELVRTHQPDVIFTDLQMPGMSGAGFSRTVRDHGYDGRIYCVTAETPARASTAILKSGLSQLISKPVSIRLLASIFCHQHKQSNNVGHAPLSLNDSVDLKIFDRTLALNRANDNIELARDLLQILMDTLPEDILIIRKYLADRDIKELKTRLHKMIGALRYCAAPGVTQAVLHLAELIREPIEVGQAPIDSRKVEKGVEQLEKEFEALNTWYKSHAGHFTLNQL